MAHFPWLARSAVLVVYFCVARRVAHHHGIIPPISSEFTAPSLTVLARRIFGRITVYSFPQVQGTLSSRYHWRWISSWHPPRHKQNSKPLLGTWLRLRMAKTTGYVILRQGKGGTSGTHTMVRRYKSTLQRVLGQAPGVCLVLAQEFLVRSRRGPSPDRRVWPKVVASHIYFTSR